MTFRSTACEALWRRHQLAFELSVEGESKRLSPTNKVQTSRAHSLVIEVCQRNVSAKFSEKDGFTSVEERRDVERTTETVRVST